MTHRPALIFAIGLADFFASVHHERTLPDDRFGDNSGHGMLFRTFEGQLILVLHQPFGAQARANLYEMEDAGDHLRVGRHRADLDGRNIPEGRN